VSRKNQGLVFCAELRLRADVGLMAPEDLSPMERIIREQMRLNLVEFEQQVQAEVERLRASGFQPAAGEERDAALAAAYRPSRRALDRPEPVMRNGDEFLAFCRSHPGLRRWWVARVSEEGPGLPRRDGGGEAELYYAPAEKRAMPEIVGSRNAAPAEVERALLDLDSDNLDWWQEENFGRMALIPIDDLCRVLDAAGYDCRRERIEEGSVFVEISDDEEIRFVPFTLQARRECEMIFRRLRPDCREMPLGDA
jgi:hypothetical protein